MPDAAVRTHRETPEIGEPAPDLELRDQHGQPVRLTDYRGRKNVLLVFYPFAFTAVCSRELSTIRDESADFSTDDIETLGISCDPPATLRAFSEQESISYPLLSDFWPHGEVSRRYGVFLEGRGMARRGTFLVDKEGILRWKVINAPADARETDDYRVALAAVAGPATARHAYSRGGEGA